MKEKMKENTVLEPSTNTHITKSNVEVVSKFENMGTVVLNVSDDNMIVEHGHHNTVATEARTKRVIKITQQEYNPILKAFQNAFD
jgi:hypothetical protein